MANPGAGQRFEEYVRVALARSNHVHNPAELIRATKMNRNTLYDLFSGETENPGTRTMARIASALEVPLADLWAVWEGREIPPDSMQEALRRHTSAMDRTNALLGELVGYIRSSAVAIIEAGGDPERVRAASVAIDVAREDQAAGQEDDQPSEPAASFRRRKSDAGTPPQLLQPENGQ